MCDEEKRRWRCCTSLQCGGASCALAVGRHDVASAAGLAEEAVARLERLQATCDEDKRRAEAAEAAIVEQEAAVEAARQAAQQAAARGQDQVSGGSICLFCFASAPDAVPAVCDSGM